MPLYYGPITAIPTAPRICDDYAITIRRDGSWWHRGAPITRHNMVKLFARQLVRDQDGGYWLQTPAECGRITVEDLPFQITGWAQQGADIVLESDCDDCVTLSSDHPLRVDLVDGQPLPAVQLRPDIWARVSRAVYYDLAAIATEQDGWLGLASGGVFHRLGKKGDGA